MPSLRSLGPTVKPSSSLWTMNAEMPLAPLSGSVTAMTVYQEDLPPLVIQALAPSMRQPPPAVAGSRVAVVVMAVVSCYIVVVVFITIIRIIT